MPEYPEYQPSEALCSEVWALIRLSPHASCGGWTRQPGQPLVCACGKALSGPGMSDISSAGIAGRCRRFEYTANYVITTGA